MTFLRYWERKKLGDVAEIVGGGTPSTTKDNYWNGSINWYTPAEIGDKIFIDNSQRKITNLGLKNSSAKILPAGTMLFTSRAGIGKTAILKEEGSTNQGFQSIIPNVKLLDSYFIYSMSNILKKYGESHGAGSTFIEISGKELAKAKIFLPSLIEQKYISKIIYSIDDTIQLHERKCEELALIKKALLQKLFPKKDEIKPEVRYKNFSDAWEQRKLGGFLQEYSIKSKIENEYPLLSSTNKGMEYREGRTASESNIGYKILKINDLVLSPQNLWLGNININTLVTGIVSPSYKTLKINNLSLYFLLPQLKTKRMLEKYKQVSVQGASVVRRNLDFTEFMNISLVIPTNKEQEQIGEFFKQLDSLIALHQRKVKYLISTSVVYL